MVGLYPITPLLVEGTLIDPPVSVPSAIGTVPVPTHPPEPPEEPPAERDLSNADYA